MRWLLASLLCVAAQMNAQPAYFADGFHGGVWGHYPGNYTQYIIDVLSNNPAWSANLEIEPETWDSVRANWPDTYKTFRRVVADQSANGRVEFVNPAYGQSYLWNISGESVIQQFNLGMRKIHEHFPGAIFSTYSSEEPCFTSALPGILRSFGFKDAVLKNPNTCWGGYTATHSGGLVNWIGPDGTAIRAVPRYDAESLSSRSTWETIASTNPTNYILAARASGVAHPIGMCFQDAGWKFGPWLNHVRESYRDSHYVTWRRYFEIISASDPATDWSFSQEDVHVSLVWGAQVLQQVAQEVRRAENKIVAAEKLSALAYIAAKLPWPAEELDDGWHTLLLSQHHDCWIVPYNGRPGNRWIEKVAQWTSNTCEKSDIVISNSFGLLGGDPSYPNGFSVLVFNTTASERTNVVSIALPTNWPNGASISGAGRQAAPAQMINSNGHRAALFLASAPPIGFAAYKVTPSLSIAANSSSGASIFRESGGSMKLETDLYEIELDPEHGGTVKSLIDKSRAGRQLIDLASERKFNELRGYFFERKRFCSTADAPAEMEVLENGPLRVSVAVHGLLSSNRVTQKITVAAGSARIDFSAHIEWNGSPGIGGDMDQDGGYRAEQNQKAFYDSRFKLLALFPLAMENPQIFKDAPYDVLQSHLADTFFDKWPEIKNDIVLNWVDLFDRAHGEGVALLTDHTTSYAHGTNFPLGLTLEYCGVGLWGRKYSITGPTDVNYAILPHLGNWSASGLVAACEQWNQPLVCETMDADAFQNYTWRSFMGISDPNWTIPTIRVDGGNVLVRLFNGSEAATSATLRYDGPASKADMIELDGRVRSSLPIRRAAGNAFIPITLPKLGIGTLRISP